MSTTAKATAAAATVAVAALGTATALSIRHDRMLRDPETYRNPTVLELERAGRFHDRDLAVLGHEKAYGPAFDRHGETLRKIAGDKYNVFTVVHTLGRQVGSRARIDSKISSLMNYKRHGGLSDAEMTRTDRVIDILKRAKEMPAGELNPLLNKINKETVQPAIKLREAFYNGDWKKGSANKTSSRTRSRLQLERGRGRKPQMPRNVRVARRASRRAQHRG